MSEANGAARPNLQIFLFRFLEYCAEGLYDIVSFALNTCFEGRLYKLYRAESSVNWFLFKHFEWLIAKLAQI